MEAVLKLETLEGVACEVASCFLEGKHERKQSRKYGTGYGKRYDN